MTKLFLTVKDVQTILGCSYTKANDICHMFLDAGWGVRHGKMIRIRAIPFYHWAGIEMEV